MVKDHQFIIRELEIIKAAPITPQANTIRQSQVVVAERWNGSRNQVEYSAEIRELLPYHYKPGL
jgi:hypothetical protein